MAKNFGNIPQQKQAQSQLTFQQAYAYYQKGQLTKAEDICKRILKAQPRHFDALQLLSYLAFQTGRHQIAIELISKAIEINAQVPALHLNLGLILQALKRLDDAIVSFDQAIALQPNFAAAYYNRGVALSDLMRFDEAVVSYNQALALQPTFADAHNKRGSALSDLKRPDEALASYNEAIALNPGFAEAYIYRGLLLTDMKRLDEALADFEKALVFKPDYDFVLGTMLHAKMKLCHWDDLEKNLKQYETGIHSSKKITMPFQALALLDSPKLHKQIAKIWIDSMFPKSAHLGAIKKHEKKERIRIGYYSADFHSHATTYLMAELFEAHDRTKFELFGFSFGPNIQDDMRNRISSAFDHFYEVSDKLDLDIARHSRELGIDIAVDLKGFTADARTGIFAARCAPIQINYLGYPGTMGAEYIDYIIADATVIPHDNQSHYTEKVIYLPHSYQVNDSKRQISTRVFTREEVGLPESGFVFCCFNNSFKILPSIFALWMRILAAVEDSVLWLLEDNPTGAKNLRKAAENFGIDGNRLIFAERIPVDEHLARHRLADLFIDTLPYNAHTSASDALWTGLPVLTCAGKSFAGRVAASLLNAIDLSELITATPAEYETKAIALASHPDQLSDIKRKLEKNRTIAPLFNAKLFANHIELAYAAVYDRYHAGLAPDRIEINAGA